MLHLIRINKLFHLCSILKLQCIKYKKNNIFLLNQICERHCISVQKLTGGIIIWCTIGITVLDILPVNSIFKHIK